MNLPKVLVTGASGFIGEKLSLHLAQLGFSVLTTSRSGSVDYKVDLSKIQPVFPEIEYVVHCAGMAHQAKVHEINMHADTVEVTRNLLNGLLMSQLKGFVFLSSVSVYGMERGDHISESTHCNPLDAYGKCKLISEELVQTWCNQHNVPFLILRLPLVVGPDAPGNLLRLRIALKKRLFFISNGHSSMKSMIWYQDLIDLVANKMSHSTFNSGIYNLTDGVDVDFNAFVKAYAIWLKTHSPWNLGFTMTKVLARIGDLLPFLSFNSKVFAKMHSTLTFDSKKAKIDLGWKPEPVMTHLNRNIVGS